MKRAGLKWWHFALFGLFLQGCAAMGGGEGATEKATVEEHSVGAETQAPAEAEGAEAAAARMGGTFTGNPLEDPNSPLAQRVFYFAYDSYEVSPEDREKLAEHAAFLAKHPEISVVVEGHTDERGSREYNLALGERRAKAVERLLLLQGASKSQIQVISFGEERPVALGHDESAWHLNRRVELLYSGY